MTDLDTLMTHAGFIRELARGLVADEQRADDVTQQTLVAAWRTPPHNEGALKGWLRRVAVNFARKSVRDERRRAANEARTSAKETYPSAEEILEREALIRRVVDAVFGLDEPFRSTIILRFYENLSPKEIADRASVPAATVRTRLKRALDKIRGELDGAHAGDRRAWAVVLLPLCALSSPGSAPPIPEEARLARILPSGGWIAVATGVVLVATLYVSSRFMARDPGESPESSSAGAVVLRDRAGVQTFEEGPVSPVRPSDRLLSHPASEASDLTVGSLRVRMNWGKGEGPATSIRAELTEGPLLFPRNHAMNRVTGPDGTFMVSDAPAGDSFLYVDRMAGEYPVRIEPGKLNEVTIDLPRGINVNVSVVDEAGDPVQGAEILLASTYRAYDSGVVVGRTGAGGSFRIRSLSKVVLIGARAPGHAPSRMAYIRGMDTVQDVDLRLQMEGRGGSLAGIVSDPDGEPVAGALLILENPIEPKTGRLENGHGGMVSPPVRATTDAGGSFRMDGIWAGEMRLFGTVDGLAPFQTVVQIGDSQETDIRIDLEPEAVLSGIVIDADGEPVSAAEITLVDEAICEFRKARKGNSDREGRFRIPGLAPGTLRATAEGKDNEGMIITELVVSPGEELHWDAVLSRGLEIQGRVIGEEGEPLADWLVVVTAPSRSLENCPVDRIRGSSRGSASTDEDGNFRIANRVEAGHRLQVFEPNQWGRIPCASLEEVTPGPKPWVIQVPDDARPSAYVWGRLLDSNGTPLHPMRAYLMPVDPHYSFSSMLGGENGEFRLGPTQPGRYRVRVTSESAGSMILGEFDLGAGEDRDLGTTRLGGFGSLRVNLRREDGQSFTRPDLWVMDSWKEIYSTCQLEENVARKSQLLPGQYFFCLDGFGATQIGAASYPFVVKEAEETVLDVVARTGRKMFLLFEEEEKAPGWPRVMTVEVSDESGNLVWKRKCGRSKQGTIWVDLYLSPAKYRVRAIADSGHQAEGAFEVEESTQADEVFRFPLR